MIDYKLLGYRYTLKEDHELLGHRYTKLREFIIDLELFGYRYTLREFMVELLGHKVIVMEK